MLEESGTIIALEGDRAWVETTPRSACSHCTSGAGGQSCGTALVAGLFRTRPNVFCMANPLQAEVGQRVVVGIADEVLVAVSLRTYLWPLGLMLGAAWLGDWLGLGSGLQALIALGGLVCGLLWIGRATRSQTAQQRYAPQLLRLESSASLSIPVKMPGTSPP